MNMSSLGVTHTRPLHQSPESGAACGPQELDMLFAGCRTYVPEQKVAGGDPLSHDDHFHYRRAVDLQGANCAMPHGPRNSGSSSPAASIGRGIRPGGTAQGCWPGILARLNDLTAEIGTDLRLCMRREVSTQIFVKFSP